ncbi:MAG: GTPase HflX [Candidatus Omnitrophica bacterium]|nr:GTPase HflX [Candidatus Omnitrophota bacterium]
MKDLTYFRLPGVEKQYSREPKNKAYLVILQVREKAPGFLQESLEEISELVRACQIRILGFTHGHVPHPSPSHFIREGKLIQVRDEVRRLGANVLVFNVDLTPTQAGNIEAFTKAAVLDRTGVILHIFARRARSREGKLQVELAQLIYALPRLGGLGTVMSRMGGGIGGRGPGEQELERDRRKVRRRIQQVKAELQKVSKHRELIRSGRRRKNFCTVAIVGYTNAGKSTLLNALTGAQAYVEDKVFATLDPMVRMESLNGHDNLLFIDTVGFLKDLPHTLIESFHATLEEVTEADILIHVLDISSPYAQEFKKAVETVLNEIHAGEKPTILALNKADLLDENQNQSIHNQWPEGVLISAKERLGLNSLLAKLDSLVQSRKSSP